MYECIEADQNDIKPAQDDIVAVMWKDLLYYSRRNVKSEKEQETYI